MMFVASLRGLSRIGAGLMMRHNQTNRPTNGRQGKSAAVGRAHVVGWVQEFWRRRNWSCWHYGKKHQSIQCLERRPHFSARRIQS